MGRVWSKTTQRYMKFNKINSGYLTVFIPAANGKYKRELVHRLVALAFIPNPEGKEQVNHKDENKENNCVDNLEWVSRKENCNYGTRNIVRPIYCVELDRVFDGASQAGRELGIDNSSISKCCRGVLKSAGGYHWRFSDEYTTQSE